MGTLQGIEPSSSPPVIQGRLPKIEIRQGRVKFVSRESTASLAGKEKQAWPVTKEKLRASGLSLPICPPGSLSYYLLYHFPLSRGRLTEAGHPSQGSRVMPCIILQHSSYLIAFYEEGEPFSFYQNDEDRR